MSVKGKIVRIYACLDRERAAKLAFHLLGIDAPTTDGGPGSGNWGHHGRPGKRGGSGPGGGSQYRGGRSDIGFYGSRKDWINGLSGDSQHRAARYIAKTKRELNSKAEAKKKIESLFERGYLTRGEADERLKEGKLDKIDENMTPEEFVMKAGNNTDREELLNHVQGGRRWAENANKLIQENWDENDKKLATALAEKYGKAFVGGAELPDESDGTGAWQSEDLACWQDLKAKAMGIPTSGNEAPDELQYEAGLKERPKPKLTGIPKTAEENETWFDSADDDRQRLIRELMGKFNLSPENFVGLTDMNDAESRMETKIIQELVSGHSEKIQTYGDYLRAKESVLNVDARKILAAGSSEYLTPEQRQNARDLLEIGMGNDENNNSLDKVADIAEYGLLSNKDVPDYVKAYYLSLKGKVLQGATRSEPALATSYGDALRETGLIQLLKNRAAVQKRKAASSPDKYFAKRKQNAVVVHGDAFSEKINSMRKESGNYTADEIRAIGTEFSSKVEKTFDDLNKELQELREEKDARHEAYKKIVDQTVEQGFTDDLDVARIAAWNEFCAAERAIKENRKKYDGAVSDALKTIRKLGVPDKSALKLHLPGRSTVKQYVQEGYERYPSEWCEWSIMKGSIRLKKVSRGYCGTDEIAISGTGESAASTATHELGHRFESVVPGMLDAEREFYERRTDGENSQRLRDVTGNNRYKVDEVTKVDKFLDPYIGKDYNKSAFELVSMGFQMAFHHPEKLMKDRDYANFILGILAVG